ncbi:hypothetical protein D3C73_1178250 [compost metagenome]
MTKPSTNSAVAGNSRRPAWRCWAIACSHCMPCPRRGRRAPTVRSRANCCRWTSRSLRTSRSIAASCAGRSCCWAKHANTSVAPTPIRTGTTPPRWKACRSSPCPRTRTWPLIAPNGSRNTRRSRRWRRRSTRSSSKKARWPRSASAAGTTASSAWPVVARAKLASRSAFPNWR